MCHLYLNRFVLTFQYTSGIFLVVEVNPTRLRELRKARSMSIRALAREAGVSTETIYSLEHGRREWIWPRTARKLSDALGVDSAELVED